MKVTPLYGRRVASDRPLGFWSEPGEPDLTLREGAVTHDAELVHDMPDPGGEGRLRVWMGDGVHVAYDGWECRLDPSTIVYASRGQHRSPFDLVAERVLIPLHRLVHEPSFAALHGAASVIARRAVIFIGASGAGKSTTARLLDRHGGVSATDDLALFDASTLELFPGAHGVRSFERLPEPHLEGTGSGTTEPGRPLYDGSAKLWYDLEGPPAPVSPIALIVHLSRTDRWSLEQVRGASAGVLVLEHAFDLQSPPATWRKARMANVMSLTRNVTVLSCTYPADAGAPAHVPELFRRLAPWLEVSDE